MQGLAAVGIAVGAALCRAGEGRGAAGGAGAGADAKSRIDLIRDCHTCVMQQPGMDLAGARRVLCGGVSHAIHQKRTRQLKAKQIWGSRVVHWWLCWRLFRRTCCGEHEAAQKEHSHGFPRSSHGAGAAAACGAHSQLPSQCSSCPAWAIGAPAAHLLAWRRTHPLPLLPQLLTAASDITCMSLRVSQVMANTGMAHHVLQNTSAARLPALALPQSYPYTYP